MASRLTRWSLLTGLAIAGMTIGSLPPAEAPLGDLVRAWRDPYAGDRDPLLFSKRAVRNAVENARWELGNAQRHEALAAFATDRRPLLVVSYDNGRVAVDEAKTREALALWSAITPDPTAPRTLLVAVDWNRINGWLSTTATSDRCVTWLRYGRRWMDPGPRIQAGAGGCYLSTEFGAPGGWWRQWLGSVGEVEIPRATAFERRPIRTVKWFLPTWVEANVYSWEEAIAWSFPALQGCAGGRSDLCGPVLGVARDRPLDPRWADYNTGRKRLIARFPAALLADLGPARFREVWKSDTPLTVSYEQVTGRPFNEWAQEYIQRAVGRLDKENALSALSWLGWALWMVLLFAWLGARINAKAAA